MPTTNLTQCITKKRNSLLKLLLYLIIDYFLLISHHA
nr:MAG TPA: hypothetical protein [Caudoviricetes sp.]